MTLDLAIDSLDMTSNARAKKGKDRQMGRDQT